jgi:pyruvate-formate lyase
MMMAVRTIKAGCGQPLILNDRRMVPNLASTGMSIEAARDYYNQGCTEIMIQGKDATGQAAAAWYYSRSTSLSCCVKPMMTDVPLRICRSS